MRNKVSNFSSAAGSCGPVPGEEHNYSIINPNSILIAKPQELAPDCVSGRLLIKQKLHVFIWKFEVAGQFGKDGSSIIDRIAERTGILVSVNADDQPVAFSVLGFQKESNIAHRLFLCNSCRPVFLFDPTGYALKSV